MSHILLIEDELHIAEGIKLNLELLGHEVTVKDNGRAGLDYWKNHTIDLLILDLMLPELSGEKVLEEIRKSDDQFPVLVLSAKDAVKSKVDCFKLGTDDYLAKPFDLEEFIQRVQRLLKRSTFSKVDLGEKYLFGDNWVDFKNFRANAKGKDISLTEQEMKILKCLVESAGEAVERKELLKILGYSEESETRTIDNFIVRFRKYFEQDPKDPKHFKSIRSVGYTFNREV